MSEIGTQVRPRLRLDALRFDAEFLDDLIEGMLVVGHDGVITDCNRAAGEILLLDADELVGANLFESRWATVLEDGSPVSLDGHPVMVTLRTGKARLGVVLGLDLPNVRRWLRVDSLPFAVDRSAQAAVVRFTDITEQMQRERNLRLLLMVSRLATSVSEVSEFLQLLCTTFVELGRCRLACVAVSGESGIAELEIAAAAGATDFLYEGRDGSSVPERIEFHPITIAMRSRVLQVENRLAALPEFDPLRRRAEEFGIRSLAAAPFVLGQRDAVLALCSAHANAFDELAVQGLESAAKDIDFGIAHMLTTKELEASVDGTLAALSQAVDSRDPYTAGHQARVGALGAAIAERLGLDLKLTQLIRRSGQVHDVGKIAVPAEILTRPGRLSTLEYEMVKGHTVVGHEILSKASLPWPIAEVALRHHERLDGSGYPDGLSAEEISLPARIIAVADVVEAMTQHRPYRAALGLQEALAEVVNGAGTRYDAEVVSACVAVFEAGFAFDSDGGRELREDLITR